MKQVFARILGTGISKKAVNNQKSVKICTSENKEETQLSLEDTATDELHAKNEHTEHSETKDTLSKENDQEYQVKNQINSHGQIVNQYNNFCEHKQLPKKKFFHFNMPDPVKSFCGREEELEKINGLFSKKKAVAICGLAGIGKSELSKHYAWNNEDTYQKNLVWINAENEEILSQSFRNLAAKINVRHNKNIKIVVQDVYSYFEEKRVLFVIDNALNRRQLQLFLPSAKEHKDFEIFLLITSQNTEWGENISTLPLSELPQEAAINVLQILLKDKFDERDTSHYYKLANMVNNIPLALQISAAYIFENIKTNLYGSFSVREYVDLLEKEEHLLLDEPFPLYSENEYDKTIYASVKISLDKIEKTEHMSKTALDLLNIFAYLDADQIYDTNLLKLKFINGDLSKLSRALALLKNYSLIINIEETKQKDKECRIIRMHRLVQWILRHHQTQCSTDEKYYENALFLSMDELPPSTFTLKYAEKYIKIVNDFYSKYKSSNVLKIFTASGNIKNLLSLFECLPKKEVAGLIDTHNLLHSAIYNYQVTSLKLLLTYEANPNRMGTEYWSWETPLQMAVSLYYLKDKKEVMIECIHELVKFGKANINIRSLQGRTLLHWVSWRKCPSLLIFLIEKCYFDVNVQDYNGQTPLFAAIDPDISPEDHDNRVMTTFKLLVKYGASTDIVDYKKRSLLHWAVKMKCDIVIEYLVKECRADINLQDSNGWSPLFFLVNESNSTKNPSVAFQQLLKYGARTNIVDSMGRTILHWAVLQRNTSLVKYLLEEAKVNTDIKDVNKQTAHFMLASRDTSRVKNRTEEYEIYNLLLKNSSFIYDSDNEGRCLLHRAVQLNCIDLVTYLLTEYDIDVDVQDMYGNTSLHLLSESWEVNHEETEKIANLLLLFGACESKQNQNNLTPSQHALLHGYRELAKFLE